MKYYYRFDMPGDDNPLYMKAPNIYIAMRKFAIMFPALCSHVNSICLTFKENEKNDEDEFVCD